MVEFNPLHSVTFIIWSPVPECFTVSPQKTYMRWRSIRLITSHVGNRYCFSAAEGLALYRLISDLAVSPEHTQPEDCLCQACASVPAWNFKGKIHRFAMSGGQKLLGARADMSLAARLVAEGWHSNGKTVFHKKGYILTAYKLVWEHKATFHRKLCSADEAWGNEALQFQGHLSCWQH